MFTASPVTIGFTGLRIDRGDHLSGVHPDPYLQGHSMRDVELAVDVLETAEHAEGGAKAPGRIVS